MQEQTKSPYITTTEIPGLLIINRPIFPDERGFFREIGRAEEIEQFIGVPFHPVQFNHSLSQIGFIRGLHAENWNKLVYPVTGKMFAAFADLRPNAPTFGKVVTITVDDNNRHSLFISHGIANSICALDNEKNEPVNYIYAVDAYYDGTDTTAVIWNDPDLAIHWPIKNPILSERDTKNETLRQLFPKMFKK